MTSTVMTDEPHDLEFPEPDPPPAPLPVLATLRRYIEEKGAARIAPQLVEVELDDISSGELTKTELRRIYSMVIRSLLMQGVNAAEIQQKLGIGRVRYEAITKGMLKAGMDLDVPTLREIENMHLDATRKTVLDRIEDGQKTSDLVSLLAVKNDVTRLKAKLNGLNAPEVRKIEQTQHVQIVLEAFNSRDELPQEAMPALPAPVVIDAIASELPEDSDGS